MNRQQIRSWTAPLRVAAQLFAPTGTHRARPHGAIVDTEFVTCKACGGVETAATRHGNTLMCAEGHLQDGA